MTIEELWNLVRASDMSQKALRELTAQAILADMPWPEVMPFISVTMQHSPFPGDAHIAKLFDAAVDEYLSTQAN